MIVIFNDQGKCFCESKDFANAIFESGNVIVTFGQNFIEIFSFSQIQSNNNNNNLVNNLEKKYEIPINNNNNKNLNNDNNINIINNNQGNKGAILCVELYKDIIICGHSSGILSFWKPTPGVYLQFQIETQISQSAINKILVAKLMDNNDYLIIGCADKTLQVFSLEANKIIKSFNEYQEEIVDIKQDTDYDNQVVILLCMKNGLIKVLNNNLEFMFNITSRFKVETPRLVISMKNQSLIPLSQNNQYNSKGDLILVTEGNIIDIYTWIKPTGPIPEIQGKKTHPNNDNNKYHHPHQQNQNFHGPHPMPHYFNRGGKFH